MSKKDEKAPEAAPEKQSGVSRSPDEDARDPGDEPAGDQNPKAETPPVVKPSPTGYEARSDSRPGKVGFGRTPAAAIEDLKKA